MLHCYLGSCLEYFMNHPCWSFVSMHKKFLIRHDSSILITFNDFINWAVYRAAGLIYIFFNGSKTANIRHFYWLPPQRFRHLSTDFHRKLNWLGSGTKWFSLFFVFFSSTRSTFFFITKRYFWLKLETNMEFCDRGRYFVNSVIQCAMLSM